ncbi:hypothetical protein X798_06561 [Onchocerca flexuosa]|uniref:Uncharacterized protein n=1 Tax=Onchocerca flexuosa TaxID=387005 RepID=A0A238BP83_9BILA|nr:hypothetical protein X798_06561 [Onchocerca flexuosa]
MYDISDHIYNFQELQQRIGGSNENAMALLEQLKKCLIGGADVNEMKEFYIKKTTLFRKEPIDRREYGFDR